MLDRAAHRHSAPEYELVVCEIRRKAAQRPGQRKQGLPQSRAAPRPFDDEKGGADGQRYRHIFQSRPGQQEEERGERRRHAAVARPQRQRHEQQCEHEQGERGLHPDEEGALRENGQRHGDQRRPRQTRETRRQRDKRDTGGENEDFEEFYGEKRRLRVERKKERNEKEHPQGMVAVGPRNAAVETGEMPLGRVPGDLKVIEGVVAVEGDKTEHVGVGDRVDRKRKSVSDYSPDKKNERYILTAGAHCNPVDGQSFSYSILCAVSTRTRRGTIQRLWRPGGAP